MPKDLRSYLRDVARIRPGDFVVVEEEVDPKWGITAYTEMFEERKEDPILYFKKVKGTKVPVIANVHSTYERLAISIDSTKEDMVEEFARRASQPIPPRDVQKPPVKDIVLKGSDAQLSMLPLITHNELDAGPYICSAMCTVRDPDTGLYNSGIYRHQIRGNRLGLMVNPGNHANFVMRKYKALDRPMEVAVVLGHHPTFFMAAGGSRLPGIGGEYELAGGLIKEPLEIVKGETVDLQYPANAEIVIEGVVDDLAAVEEEGDFGEYPRYYSGKKTVPFIRPTAIVMRKDAIFQDIIAAHNEHITLGALPRMATYLQRIRALAPNVAGVNLPKSGSSRAHMYLSIRKTHDGEGKHAGLCALAADPNIKMVVVVDDDIDVMNEEDVLSAVAFRFEADRDLVVVPYTLGAHLNPSSYAMERTKKGIMQSRLILDATWPAPPYVPAHKATAPTATREKTDLQQAKRAIDDSLRSRLGI